MEFEKRASQPIRSNPSNTINIANYKNPYDMKIALYAKEIRSQIKEEGRKLSEIPFTCNASLFALLFYSFSKINRNPNDILLIKHYLINFPNLIKTIYQKKVFYDANELLNKIALFLKCEEIKHNTLICRLGEIGEKFYLIFQGSVAILIPRDHKEKMTESEYYNHLLMLYELKEFELIQRTIASNYHVFFSYDIFQLRNRLDTNTDILKADELKEIISINDYIKRLQPKPPLDSEMREGPINTVIIWSYFQVATSGEGQTFGDIALSHEQKKRTASIIALEKTYCGTLEISVYKTCIKDAQDKIRKMNVNVLISTPIFYGIGMETFEKKFFNSFRNLRLGRGEELFSQGSTVVDVYFIKEGEISISFKGSFNLINKLIITKGGIFDINKELVMTKKCSSFAKYYENTNQLHRLMNIGQKGIIGLDEYLYEGKFFCEGKCSSEKAEIFAIDINIFNSIIKTEHREEKIKNYVQLKNTLLLERLIQMKEKQMNKRYETLIGKPNQLSILLKALSKELITKVENVTIKENNIEAFNNKKIVRKQASKKRSNSLQGILLKEGFSPMKVNKLAFAIELPTTTTDIGDLETNQPKERLKARSFSIMSRKSIWSMKILEEKTLEKKIKERNMKRFLEGLKLPHSTLENINDDKHQRRNLFDKVIHRKDYCNMPTPMITLNTKDNNIKCNIAMMTKSHSRDNIIDMIKFDHEIEKIEPLSMKRKSHSAGKIPKIMRIVQNNIKPIVKMIKPPKPKKKSFTIGIKL